MKSAAKLLLTNQQGGVQLHKQMCVSPDLPSENKIVGSIVVHAIAVLFASTNNPFLTAFHNMLSNPEALTVCLHDKYSLHPSLIYECVLECIFTNNG